MQLTRVQMEKRYNDDEVERKKFNFPTHSSHSHIPPFLLEWLHIYEQEVKT